MDELNRKSVAEFKRSDKTTVIAVIENVRSAYNEVVSSERQMHFYSRVFILQDILQNLLIRKLRKQPLEQKILLTGNIFLLLLKRSFN
jgi:hypothetical protein